MVMRFDPFRDFDRLASEVFGTARTPAPMPMDCLRSGDQFVLRFDLPGIDTESLEVMAENNTLTVRAERHRDDPDDATYVVSERPSGSFSRQLVLGEGLNVDDIRADYRAGVLTLTIPVADQARPRRIEVTGERTAVGSHEGHKLISGEAGQDRQPATAGTGI
jgi:HSP20 family protein